jgi:hypothetical protein
MRSSSAANAAVAQNAAHTTNHRRVVCGDDATGTIRVRQAGQDRAGRVASRARRHNGAKPCALGGRLVAADALRTTVPALA